MTAARQMDVWTSVCTGGGYHVDSAELSPPVVTSAGRLGTAPPLSPISPQVRPPCAHRLARCVTSVVTGYPQQRPPSTTATLEERTDHEEHRALVASWKTGGAR